MKVKAELTHPERVDITMTITMNYGQWEAVHDALRIGIEAQAKVREPGLRELNTSINEVLNQVVTVGEQGLSQRLRTAADE